MEENKNNEIFQECLLEMKNLYEKLLLTIEDLEEEDDDHEYSNNLNQIKTILNEQSILQQDTKLKSILLIILNICNNHHRTLNFLEKIKETIKYLKQMINETFSNTELFNLFLSNKLILLFLLDEKIITFDKDIYNCILKEKESGNKYLWHFFYPEIKNFASEGEIIEIEKELIEFDPNYQTTFCENRQKGENEKYICSLIRNDEVEKFISYVNSENISLSSSIKPSIYETNLFLTDKNPTLIEYAAFYGSIQIFQYLLRNDEKVNDENLWIYSIHSKNAELIHLLESNLITLDDQSMEKVYLESIKCHHNKIVEYIENILLNRKIDIVNDMMIENEEIISTILKYHNYLLLPEDFENNNNNGFFYLYKYEYFKLVELFLNTKKVDDISTENIKQAIIENKIHIAYLMLEKQTKIDSSIFENFHLMKKFIIPPTIKIIGDYAFNRCSSLTEIIIPSSVIEIGKCAFKGCSSLTEIVIPSSVTSIGYHTFKNCTLIKRITFLFPSSITEIGFNNAILGCSSLTHLTIPSSVTSIEKSAFKSCSSLEHITFETPSSLTTIGSNAFRECSSLKQITIPSSVTQIEYEAFIHCSSLTKITIQSSDIEIGKSAFINCASLIQIEFASSMPSVKRNSFDDIPNILFQYGPFYYIEWIYQKEINYLYVNTSNVMHIFPKKICKKVKYITLMPNVKTIDNNAFLAFLRLKKITIPSSVTKIKDSAFQGCSSLIEITIPPSVSEIGDKLFMGCSSLKHVELPQSLKKIARFMFSKCKSLVNVSIPSSVEIIGEYAFSECESIVEIIIPKNVKIIEVNTFEKCTSLRKVILPEELEEINEEAFLECISLENIIIPQSVNYINEASFLKCPVSNCIDYSSY